MIMLININPIQMLAGLLLLLLLTSASAVPTTGLPIEQANSSSQPGSVQSVNDPAVLIKEVQKNLAETKEKLALVPSNTLAGTDADNTAKRRLYLTQLMYMYQGQLARLADLQRIQQDRIALEKKVSDWSGFSEPSDHPFLRADELQESVMTLSKRLNELESWIADNEQVGTYLL